MQVTKDATQITDLIFNIWTGEYNFKVNRGDYPDLANSEIYAAKGGYFLIAKVDENIVRTIATEQLSEDIFLLKRMWKEVCLLRQICLL